MVNTSQGQKTQIDTNNISEILKTKDKLSIADAAGNEKKDISIKFIPLNIVPEVLEFRLLPIEVNNSEASKEEIKDPSYTGGDGDIALYARFLTGINSVGFTRGMGGLAGGFGDRINNFYLSVLKNENDTNYSGIIKEYRISVNGNILTNSAFGLEAREIEEIYLNAGIADNAFINQNDLNTVSISTVFINDAETFGVSFDNKTSTESSIYIDTTVNQDINRLVNGVQELGISILAEYSNATGEDLYTIEFPENFAENMRDITSIRSFRISALERNIRTLNNPLTEPADTRINLENIKFDREIITLQNPEIKDTDNKIVLNLTIRSRKAHVF